jgi:large subunit ribosomal protein L31
MKPEIHPSNYRLVVFKDMSDETLMLDGVEYPVAKLEISSSSHPFYTGKIKLVDTAGRVDKFRNRYKGHQGKINM